MIKGLVVHFALFTLKVIVLTKVCVAKYMDFLFQNRFQNIFDTYYYAEYFTILFIIFP